MPEYKMQDFWTRTAETFTASSDGYARRKAKAAQDRGGSIALYRLKVSKKHPEGKWKDLKLKSNPNPSLRRNKWVNAKIMVTSSGKIKAKVPKSAIR